MSARRRKRAIRLYETHGYVRWGRNPFYARVEGKPVAGLYYWKDLNAASGEGTGGPG